MKCIVLAGGSGDRLWPISRHNFPKQFVHIRKGRSMFQETILRNMAFCDEFFIISNASYSNIVKNQLRVFQSLNYTLFLEPVPLETAPAQIKICLGLDPEEELLIVSCDYLIEGDYNSAIVDAKVRLLEEDKLLTLVVPPANKKDGYHFLRDENGTVSFSSNYSDGAFWECGVTVCRARTFLRAVDKDYLELCRKIRIEYNYLVCDNEEEVARRIYQVIDYSHVALVKCHFVCGRIADLSDLYAAYGKENINNDIVNNGENVEVINAAPDRLLVVNGLKDVMVVNTKDAIYLTSIEDERSIKKIAKAYEGSIKQFDISPVLYYAWGTSERLNKTKHTKVNKLTIYPGSSARFSHRLGYAYNYVISSGEIEFEVNNKIETYKKNDSISILTKSRFHILRNKTAKDVRIVEIVDSLSDDDEVVDESFVFKLRPVYMDFLWGGTRIKDVLNKDTYGYETVAESWELSAHKNGQSFIDSGKYKGMKFSKFIRGVGAEQLGWKVNNYTQFPLMIKFIDARRNLSIQVHPQDDYAFKNENDYGKNEMWYIIDAEPGSYIYVGFDKDVTKEEVEERIKNRTITSILNKIYVTPGESYYIEAGTVHAIGAGCLVCEVQQSSDVTYRLYDYGRLDKNGKPRKLHIKQAFDVLDFAKKDIEVIKAETLEESGGIKKSLLAECKYFVTHKYEINGVLTLSASEATFKALVIIDGEGTIEYGKTRSNVYKGDTWFCGCNEIVKLKGNMTILVSHV